MNLEEYSKFFKKVSGQEKSACSRGIYQPKQVYGKLSGGKAHYMLTNISNTDKDEKGGI